MNYLKDKLANLPQLITVAYFVVSTLTIVHLQHTINDLNNEKDLIRKINKENIQSLKDSLTVKILSVDKEQTDSVIKYFTNLVNKNHKQ